MHIRFIISRKKQETPEAWTLYLTPENGIMPPYQPGQFLTFIFQHFTSEFRRSYSISSIPGEPTINITIKRQENGAASRYLTDIARVGDVLVSLPPSGSFTIGEKSETPRDLFLIGAGSGITPLMSILKNTIKEEPYSHIKLVYSNKSIASTIFYDELRALEKEHVKQLQINWLYSNRQELSLARLHRWMLEDLVANTMHFDPQKALFFICGPIDYMDMIQVTLYTLGFPKNNVRKELFVIEEPEIDKSLYENQLSYHATIHFDKQVLNIEVPPRTTILDAALQQHIELPYSCKSGKCSTCSVHLLKGKVKISYNEVLTDKDLDNGRVLTCTGYPASDVELSYDQLNN